MNKTNLLSVFIVKGVDKMARFILLAVAVFSFLFVPGAGAEDTQKSPDEVIGDMEALGRLVFLYQQAARSPEDVYAAKAYEVSQAGKDPEIKREGAATYALWLLATGKRADGANLIRNINKTYGTNRFASLFSMQQYQTPCEKCNAAGKIQVQCARCKGTVKCKSCKGTGQVEGFDGRKSECHFCKGSGKCQSCKGSGVELAPCPACGGAAGFISREALMNAFVARAEEQAESTEERRRIGSGYKKVGKRWMTEEEIKAEEAEKARGMAVLSRDDEEKQLFNTAISQARSARTFDESIKILTEAIDKRPGSAYATGAIMLRNEYKQKRAEQIRSRNE